MTALQRLAISSLVLPFLPVGVTPNASPDEAWRLTVAWSYPTSAVFVSGGEPVSILGSVNAGHAIVGSVNAAASVGASVNAAFSLLGSKRSAVAVTASVRDTFSFTGSP